MVLLITEESARSTREYEEDLILKESLSCAQAMISFSKTTLGVCNPILLSYSSLGFEVTQTLFHIKSLMECMMRLGIRR